ncbi:MAG: hypothetical protein ACTSSG_09185 [Candidatus Heimdallarchaeaceae archaeon]
MTLSYFFLLGPEVNFYETNTIFIQWLLVLQNLYIKIIQMAILALILIYLILIYFLYRRYKERITVFIWFIWLFGLAILQGIFEIITYIVCRAGYLV